MKRTFHKPEMQYRIYNKLASFIFWCSIHRCCSAAAGSERSAQTVVGFAFVAALGKFEGLAAFVGSGCLQAVLHL